MTQPTSDQTSAPAPLRHVTVSAVHWRNILDFAPIFRSFRLAMNPAKIMLALLALLLIYSAGRLFDFAWGPQAYTDEIVSYQAERPQAYAHRRDSQLSQRTSDLQIAIALAPGKQAPLNHDQIADLAAHPRAAYRYLKAAYIEKFHADLDDAALSRAASEKMTENPFATPDSKTPAQIEQDARAAAARDLYNNITRIQHTIGRGIFDSFMDYELHQFDALIDNSLSFIRIAPARSSSLDNQIPGLTLTPALAARDSDSLSRSDTIAGTLYNMVVTAPTWLVSATAPMQWHSATPDTWLGWFKMLAYRALYLVSLFLFLLISYAILALAGGTISRLSALELAGIERASLSEVFLFALRRLGTFIKAPITPFLILLVVGLILTAVSLIGAVPYVGEIILGVIFIGLILIGFVLMLLVLGILGGLNLLFAAIAVEGADAFDAMSRAFAYVYSRPWRLLIYTSISLVYGAITYLFVTFAAWLVLLLTHTFAAWGTNFFGHANGRYSGSPKLDTLWPAPKFGHLLPLNNWYAMNWSEYLGSLFLHFWLYLFLTAIAGFVISYYFSTHTIIYLLLRRAVDGQSPTEVFLEEPTPAPSTPAPAPSTPSTSSS